MAADKAPKVIALNSEQLSKLFPDLDLRTLQPTASNFGTSSKATVPGHLISEGTVNSSGKETTCTETQTIEEEEGKSRSWETIAENGRKQQHGQSFPFIES